MEAPLCPPDGEREAGLPFPQPVPELKPIEHLRKQKQ
jgi:hypothetical protein